MLVTCRDAIASKNKSQNLVICLEGVTSQDINNCLDYMYNGEVQMYQENLDKFLIIAQRFKIKGLLQSSPNQTCENNEKQVLTRFKVEPKFQWKLFLEFMTCPRMKHSINNF